MKKIKTKALIRILRHASLERNLKKIHIKFQLKHLYSN